jgi:predicted metalloprotease
MSFNDNADLDTSQVEGGGGGGGMLGGGGMPGGGLAIGGGAGGVLLLILYLVFGGLGGGSDSSSTQGSRLDQGQVQSGGSQPGTFSRCRKGADANRDAQCRVIGTVNSVQAYWQAALPRYGTRYTPSRTVLYSGSARSGCGTASNQVGPFYCPLDRKVYIDASFFNELTSRFGADSGALAQEYVVAHEYGHHVKDLLGVLDAAQSDLQGAESGAVRVELMADCLAGVWAKHATETKDAQGDAFLQPLTQKDIRSALSAASAVGDDRIQQKAQGRVNPESWTHGSSAQRQKWFTTGYQSGDLNACDTLHAPTV